MCSQQPKLPLQVLIITLPGIILAGFGFRHAGEWFHRGVFCPTPYSVSKTVGYCWPTSFKVLGVLFLGEVSSAFLPSKKVCWAHQFRYLGVGQQYPVVFETHQELHVLSLPA